MSLMEKYKHIFARKTRFQLILISMAVCGIEFCYSAETALVTPILLGIGVSRVMMTLIWCIGPFLGFFLVPLVGSISDRCSCSWGRRRPFILIWSVGIVVGLLLVPYGGTIGNWISGIDEDEEEAIVAAARAMGGDARQLVNASNVSTSDLHGNLTSNSTEPTSSSWQMPEPNIATIVLTGIGAVLLDCCDACQSPSRTFLIEVTVAEDHPRGLSTFTIMAGLGGAIGYVIGGIDWDSTVVGHSLGGHDKVVFSSVLIIYLICVTITCFSAKEVPLHELGPLNIEVEEKKALYQQEKERQLADERVRRLQIQEEDAEEERSSITSGKRDAPDYGTGEHYSVKDEKVKLVIPAGEMIAPSEVTLRMYLSSICHAPRSLLVLCFTNLLSWMSLMCYTLYFTDFVGEAVYGGEPRAPPGSEAEELFQTGVRVGSFGMALFSITASVYSYVMESLVKNFGAKPVYICSPLVYTIGATLLATIRRPAAVVVLSICPGIIYATQLTLPYLLVAHYHSTDQFEQLPSIESLEKRRKYVRGLGTDIGMVSSMVFIAQALLCTCIGSIVEATGTTVAYMVCAAVLSAFGSIAATQVTYLDL